MHMHMHITCLHVRQRGIAFSQQTSNILLAQLTVDIVRVGALGPGKKRRLGTCRAQNSRKTNHNDSLRQNNNTSKKVNRFLGVLQLNDYGFIGALKALARTSRSCSQALVSAPRPASSLAAWPASAHARLGLGYLRGLCRRSALAPGERCVCGPVAQALKDRLLLCGQGVDEDVCPGAPPGCALLNSEMTSVVSARESLSSRTSQEALTWRGGRTG